MKKILFSVLLLGLVISSAWSSESSKSLTNKEEIETISVGANYIEYENETSQFEDADLVVIAKVDKEFYEREHFVTYFPISFSGQQKEIQDFYTKTPITIKKILKKPEESTLDKDSKLTIIEPITLMDDANGKLKLTTEHYLELENNKNYVLYLKKNTYGEYGIIHMNNGRFNIDVEKELKVKNIDIDEEKLSKHDNMKKEIMKKYEKEIKEIQETKE